METQATYNNQTRPLLSSLIKIQSELKAPKKEINKFGGYNYRTLEGIEESIKPLLKDEQCGIRFQDEIIEHCGRTFLKTTLFFFNVYGDEISTTAEAEHETEKKGMDKSQITGAASSYARKYAMNAMFAIDDSKDADTNEFQNQTQGTTPQGQQPQQATPVQQATPAKKKALKEYSIDELVGFIKGIKEVTRYNKANQELSREKLIENQKIKEALNEKYKELTKK